MATVPLLSDEEAPAESRAVFEAVRAARGTDYVNNFWRALAHDPALLRATWERLSAVMGPGALDPLVKEMVYLAVSTANGCSYCVHSHTAAARATSHSRCSRCQNSSSTAGSGSSANSSSPAPTGNSALRRC